MSASESPAGDVPVEFQFTDNRSFNSVDGPGGHVAHQRRIPGVGLPSVLDKRAPAARHGGDLAQLFTALAKARNVAREVPKDALNKHHNYYYASAESVATEARAAMAETGLSVVPLAHELLAPPAPAPKVVLVLRSRYMLTHAAGGWFILNAVDWPVIDNKGKDVDKAFASARTSSRAYVLLDILNLSRGDEDEDVGAAPDAGPPAAPARGAGLSDHSMEELHKKVRGITTTDDVAKCRRWVETSEMMSPAQKTATLNLCDFRLGQIVAKPEAVTPPAAEALPALKVAPIETTRERLAAADPDTLRKYLNWWKKNREAYEPLSREAVDKLFKQRIAELRATPEPVAPAATSADDFSDQVPTSVANQEADEMPRASVAQALAALCSSDLELPQYEALMTWWSQQLPKATQREAQLMNEAFTTGGKIIDARAASGS